LISDKITDIAEDYLKIDKTLNKEGFTITGEFASELGLNLL
jgi:hypothetical protein